MKIVRSAVGLIWLTMGLTSSLLADAPNTKPVMEQGDAAYVKKDFDTAIARFEEATRLDPQLIRAHYALGLIYSLKGQNTQAIACLTKALRLDSKDDHLYFSRGYMLWQNGDPEQAVEDFSMAVQLNPLNDLACNGLAWALSTSPQDQLRVGKRAVQLARKACELTKFKNPFHLSTLAAAYAEVGDFDQAIKWHKQAVAFPDFPKDKLDRANQRFKLYEQNKPYREVIEKRK